MLLHNVGGIGFIAHERSKETMKMERLKKFIIEQSVDLTCLSEVNKDWRLTKEDNTIWSGTKGWRQYRRVQVSTNTTKTPTKEYKVGGTAMIGFDELAFRISMQEEDDRGLGRWSIITLTGKNGLKTTFLTCYCPVVSASPGSAYAQQLTYMAENKEKVPENIKCPRQLFGHDLKITIGKYANMGNQMIVCGDFNSEYSALSEWFLDEGLQDIIAEKNGVMPITYQRSKKDPLDCVFGSPSIKIKNGGCLSFGRLISDHRGIWFDIPNTTLFGFNPQQITHPQARRLKMEDPRVVKKYNDYLHKKCMEENLYVQWDNLHKKATSTLSHEMINAYENLDKVLEDHMEKAELQCRKLKMGQIPWSPSYKKIQLEFDYWRMRSKYKLGLYKNVRKLQVLQNQLHIVYDKKLSLYEIETKIKECYQKKKNIVLMSESLSLEYRQQLAAAKEADGEIKAATYLRNLNRIERQRRLFQNIRRMEDKQKGGSTNKVVITDEDGLKKEYNNKEEMEKVIAVANEKKWHQTEGGSELLSNEMIELLGNYGEGSEVRKVMQGTFVPPANTSRATKDFYRPAKNTKVLVN